MKFKEFNEHRKQIREDNIIKYCELHNISYEEYKKAEKKNNLIGECVLFGLWFIVLLCIIFVDVVGKKDNPIKNTTPVVTNVQRAVNPTKNITLNNYSSEKVYYSLYNEYDEIVLPKSSASMPYNGSNDRAMMFGSENYLYHLSDDGNLNGYSDEFYSNEESFDGSFINFYDRLNSDVYLVPSSALLGSDVLTWLLGENINTGVTRNINKNYTMPVYSVDFNKEYINHYNTFNSIRVEANINVVDFSYQFSCKVYAYNTSTSSKVLLMANFSKTNSNPIINGNSLDIYYNSTYEDSRFYLAPYLNSSKLHTSGNFNSASIVGLRPMLSNDVQTITKISLPNSSTNGVELWDNIGQLIKITFISLLPIGDIYILPMVTIGALIFAPIIVLFIMLIIKVVRK